MSPRHARSTDAPAIVHVINDAYRVEDFFVHGDRTDLAGIQTKLTHTHGGFLVIDNEDASPVGEASLDGAVYVEIRGDRGYFAMLSVARTRQGRGLGRTLVAAVEEHCRAAGCRWLDLEVVDLRTELPPFYHALGFAPCGTAPFPEPHKLKHPAHVVLMTKEL